MLLAWVRQDIEGAGGDLLSVWRSESLRSSAQQHTAQDMCCFFALYIFPSLRLGLLGMSHCYWVEEFGQGGERNLIRLAAKGLVRTFR